ncbi:NAD-dependent protein deacylase [Clostridium chauvoei]|uniref:NAD-dependent protein deacetylase n=2 Tax=Clostridium chauvoei TaxID=46867 RepID=A0A1U6IWD2_9CLOT|nr:NAD-dependent protein deacylase [Clostridium chauvoei]ATD56044.1 NAD-dependent protein deacylase [Clostridium chauvoei]ATD58191.1 NAD-dependent protein deacylase [Clostridium chauvoei]MBX7281628.1 NAD-dependent protein deacylase [Clostridium chauvoei]MBX7284151.1 NAD-dependent protein deacylase [Clostridium chauvoei]MBX7286679.1 NAD-dependent protein deacylase [Clostridium chauvoei]
MESYLEKLTQILRESNNIVFFGGAGVSTASGIPDFRSSNGLFNEKLNLTFTPEQLVSHSFYIRYPKEFFNFYKAKLIYPNAKPNGAHIALAKLEEMGKLKAVITQNIDGLHQAAGSKKVFELHGSVHRNYCVKCNSSYDVDFILESKDVPTCTKCGGTIKPDVVLYEEGLDDDTIRMSIDAISKADTLIIGGTSLVVYPAAGLIDYFRGKNLVLINKSTTSADNKANLVINDSIDKVLSSALKHLNI